ncbi:hydrolase [Porphyrobacter sp. GA68]|uniref:hydrolase n=1 Tax=Porphyrobacter sp. GA68 TaxID=2883480 RepID=UPI001D197EFF|nr:hydrolase [Porphyrobacter sp. GA68]
MTGNELAELIDAHAMLEQTQAWCAINTGTHNIAGLRQQAATLAEAFSALPGEVALIQPAPVTAIDAAGRAIDLDHGHHLVLSVRPAAERRLLLTGHMDTVYAADHPFQEQCWVADGVLNGPGAADMKGGIAVILHALIAFERSTAAAQVGYDVMINSDEETGSTASAALIAELARDKYAALTYEPSALPDGTLAHARGGTGNYAIVARGRSAHAGRNPQDGRNALLALADLALRLKGLERDDLSVNPARIDGGSANNVVPDNAVLRFNIRPKTTAAMARFDGELAAASEAVAAQHEVALDRHGGVTRPPKPVDARAQKLFELVRRCGAQLGQEIGWQPTGGVCDGNNIAALGVPVVDTMGVRGGAIHSPDEYLVTASLKERAMLSALVLQHLASGDAL